MNTKYKILVCPANEGGCAFYRAINPYMKLAQIYPDRVEVRFDKNPLGIEDNEASPTFGQWKEDWEFESMKWADIVVVNNISNWGGQYTARIVGKAKEFDRFVHYDTDDLLTELYTGHRLYDVYENKGLSDITKFIYNSSDLVTVTQTKFAERISPYMNGALAVIKNAIDYSLPCWNHPGFEAPKGVCRIGWAGGIHHEEDVKEFAGIPNLVNQKVGRERVWWDFYGRPPVIDDEKEKWQHDVWENYQKIMMRGFKGSKNWKVHNALPAQEYGVMYANMDIAIAPLQMNAFNDSKSDIKVAEAGRYSVPLIASDVGCYNETIINGETGYLIPVDAPRSEWVRVLTKVIKNKKHREEMGRNLHQITEEMFNLNRVVGERIAMYDQIFADLGIPVEQN